MPPYYMEETSGSTTTNIFNIHARDTTTNIINIHAGSRARTRTFTDNNTYCPVQARKVFVGGLPDGLTDDAFRTHFSRFGRIVDSVVMRQPITRRGRGFGFVTFDTRAAAARAVMENHQNLNLKGTLVEVKWATRRQPTITPVHNTETISAAAWLRYNAQETGNVYMVSGNQYCGMPQLYHQPYFAPALATSTPPVYYPYHPYSNKAYYGGWAAPGWWCPRSGNWQPSYGFPMHARNFHASFCWQ